MFLFRNVSRALLLSVAISGCATKSDTTKSDTHKSDTTVSAPAPTKPNAAELAVADQTLACTGLAAETIRLEGQNRRAEEVIKSNRTRNQTAEYFAAQFLVPIAAVDTNEEQVALLSKNQRRQDNLRRLQRTKAC